MNTRIKILRTSLSLTQKALGAKIGVSEAAVSQYEKGKAIPSDSVLMLICREFGVNMDWLRTGEGEMYLPSASGLSLKFSFRDLTAHMLETFEQLCPEQQQAVLEYARRVVGELASQPASGAKCGSPEGQK